MKKLIAIQARSASTRLPGKIYELIGNKALLDHVITAAKDADSGDVVVIGPEDDTRLEEFCKDKCPIFLGNREDLVARYIQAMDYFKATHVARVTGDCPFVTKDVIRGVMEILNKADYVSNTVIRTMVEGMGVQAASEKGWRWLDKNQLIDREHPWKEFDENALIRDQFIRDGNTIQLFVNSGNPILLKTSVDTKEDLDRARKLWWAIEKDKQDKTSTSRI